MTVSQAFKGSVLLALPQSLDPYHGGVQRSTWQMGHALFRLGWKVSFLSLSVGGHVEPEFGCLYAPKSNREAGGFGGEGGFIERVVQKSQPDIVINQIAVNNDPAKVLSKLRQRYGFRLLGYYRNAPAFFRDNHRSITRNRLARLPWIFSAIDRPWVWNLILKLHRRKASKAFRLAMSRCDRLILLSEKFEDELRWYLPEVNHNHLRFLPNAFVMSQTPERHHKQKVLLAVSRMENSQKNILMLPELWSLVKSQLPGWELHIVGDGPDLKRLDEEFAGHDASRVLLHGQIKPQSLYKKASIFVMLSAYEGFGNTLIEAQQEGAVPVVFRSFASLETIVNDQVDAALVPAFDLEAFAVTVITLASDQHRLMEMSIAAGHNARRFSEQVVSCRLEELLQSELGIRSCSDGEAAVLN